MKIFVTLIAALLGWMAEGEEGFFFGGLLGLGLAFIWEMRRDLGTLRARVDALSGGPAAESATPESATAPPRLAEPDRDSWTTPAARADLTAIDADAEPVVADPTVDASWSPSQGAAPDASEGSWNAPPPRDPSDLERRLGGAAEWVKRFFTTGNLVVRVGVVVLFFGVAFLLRYAYENSVVPVELRLVGTAVAGILLVVAGWRLRHRSDTYGLVLQGAGVGVLYLTIFAAARLYELLPMSAALFALIALVSASSVLAVLQRSQALAIFSMSGGFLAPVLVSTGSGSHVALFSYYALLNAGIVGMAWFQHWRWLNWVGFVFTFAIGGLWGVEYYEPRYFATTQPFLLLSFFFYLGVSMLFARRNPVELRGVIDGTLVFGTPVVAFAMQAALVREMEFGLAFSALGAALTYTLLAWWLKRQGAFATLLGQSFVALGVGFATLAIPFAFDDQRFTAATWALEGAGLVWVGLRQQQRLPRFAGMALQLAAALAFLSDWQRGGDAMLFANGAWFGAVMIALGAGFTGYQLSSAGTGLHRLERGLAAPFVFWGACWWLAGGLREVAEFQPSWYPQFSTNNVSANLGVLFMALSAVALTAGSRRLNWRLGLAPGYLLLPLGTLAGLVIGIESAGRTPFADLGWLSWPVLVAAVVWHLRCVADSGADGERGAGRFAALWHAAWWWAIAAFAGWAGFSLVESALPGTIWSAVCWGAAPLLCVALLLAIRHRNIWPINQFPASYYGWGMLVMAIYLIGWLVVSGMYPGLPDPLAYVVLLNPLELVQLGVLLTLLGWLRALNERNVSGDSLSLGERVVELRAGVGLVGFIWLNLTAARAVHVYGGVAYPVEHIIGSDLFQATASILWTLAAVVLMVAGTRRPSRPAWIVGAVLLGLVILKLFLVDLSNLETIARIVSFVSVGLLMLIIGYFAPLPPDASKGDGSPDSPGSTSARAETAT